MLETLNPQPQDKILALIQMFKDDPRSDKIDLGVGVYKDATGLTPVMRAVKAAEKKLWETETTKSYTTLAGDPAFNVAAAKMILANSMPVDRIASVATPGGTGAIRQALELIVQTFDALTTEEGDSQRIWASTLKNAIKRRKPDFSESYHGFKAFGHLLEEAQARGLLTLGRDERSGTYVSRASAPDLVVRTEERKPRGARQGLAGQSGRRRGGAARNRSAEANIHADAAESRSNEDRALPNGSGQTPNAAAVTPAASGPSTRATDNGAAVSTPSARETTNTNPPPRRPRR